MMTPATAWSSFPFAAPPAAPRGPSAPPPPPAGKAVAGFARDTKPSNAKRASYVAGFARATGGK